jgi:hypothetical protein
MRPTTTDDPADERAEKNRRGRNRHELFFEMLHGNVDVHRVARDRTSDHASRDGSDDAETITYAGAELACGEELSAKEHSGDEHEREDTVRNDEETEVDARRHHALPERNEV